MKENPSVLKREEWLSDYLPPHLPSPHFASSATNDVVLKATIASKVANPKRGCFFENFMLLYLKVQFLDLS